MFFLLAMQSKAFMRLDNRMLKFLLTFARNLKRQRKSNRFRLTVISEQTKKFLILITMFSKFWWPKKVAELTMKKTQCLKGKVITLAKEAALRLLKFWKRKKKKKKRQARFLKFLIQKEILRITVWNQRQFWKKLIM